MRIVQIGLLAFGLLNLFHQTVFGYPRRKERDLSSYSLIPRKQCATGYRYDQYHNACFSICAAKCYYDVTTKSCKRIEDYDPHATAKYVTRLRPSYHISDNQTECHATPIKYSNKMYILRCGGMISVMQCNDYAFWNNSTNKCEPCNDYTEVQCPSQVQFTCPNIGSYSNTNDSSHVSFYYCSENTTASSQNFTTLSLSCYECRNGKKYHPLYKRCEWIVDYKYIEDPICPCCTAEGTWRSPAYPAHVCECSPDENGNLTLCSSSQCECDHYFDVKEAKCIKYNNETFTYLTYKGQETIRNGTLGQPDVELSPINDESPELIQPKSVPSEHPHESEQQEDSEIDDEDWPVPDTEALTVEGDSQDATESEESSQQDPTLGETSQNITFSGEHSQEEHDSEIESPEVPESDEPSQEDRSHTTASGELSQETPTSEESLSVEPTTDTPIEEVSSETESIEVKSSNSGERPTSQEEKSKESHEEPVPEVPPSEDIVPPELKAEPQIKGEKEPPKFAGRSGGLKELPSKGKPDDKEKDEKKNGNGKGKGKGKKDRRNSGSTEESNEDVSIDKTMIPESDFKTRPDTTSNETSSEDFPSLESSLETSSNETSTEQPLGVPGFEPSSEIPSNETSTEQPLDVPGFEPSSEIPSNETSTEQPLDVPGFEPSSENSSNETSTEQPLGVPGFEPSSEIPSNETSTEQPLDVPGFEPSSENSSNETSTEQPLGVPGFEPSSENSSNETSTEQPLDVPGFEPSSEIPSNETSTEQPLGVPGFEPSSEIPSNETSTEQPLGVPGFEPSSEIPSNETSTEKSPDSLEPTTRPDESLPENEEEKPLSPEEISKIEQEEDANQEPEETEGSGNGSIEDNNKSKEEEEKIDETLDPKTKSKPMDSKLVGAENPQSSSTETDDEPLPNLDRTIPLKNGTLLYYTVCKGGECQKEDVEKVRLNIYSNQESGFLVRQEANDTNTSA